MCEQYLVGISYFDENSPMLIQCSLRNLLYLRTYILYEHVCILTLLFSFSFKIYLPFFPPFH